MNDRDILDGVLSLYEQFPSIQIDSLCATRWNPPGDTFEQFLYDALRHKTQIVECLAWLDRCEERKQFNYLAYTYGMKHEVERDVGHWISHTSMLVALKIRRLDMRQSRACPLSAEVRLKNGRPGQV